MSVEIRELSQATVLTLCRPEKANAYDHGTLQALSEAIAEVRSRVVVVASAGTGAFCAGADLEEMGDAGPERALDLLSQRVFEQLARAPFVSIASIQGAAVAGGCELALACDLRVAGPKARFWLPETGIGLIPAAGGCTRLPAMVGLGRAKQMILARRRLDAETALDWGLVDRLEDHPFEAALAWAEEIGEGDALALRLAKEAIAAGQDTASSLQAERLAEAVLYGEAKARRGP